MSGIEEQLGLGIDEALRIRSLYDGSGQASAALRQLSALANEYLDCAASRAKPFLSEILSIAGSGSLAAGDDARFRAALQNLRESLGNRGEVARDDHLSDEDTERKDTERKLEAAANQLAEDPELVQEFLVESREHLSSVEAGLLKLEKEPHNAEALNAVFRAFHTIKGLAAFLGAAAIQELAHRTESVLDLARSGTLALSPEIIDLILFSADQLTKCLDAAATCKLSEIPRCGDGLLDNLAALALGETIPAGSEGERTARTIPGPDVSEGKPAVSTSPSVEANVLRVDASKLEYLIDMVGELVIAESVVRHDPRISQTQDALLSRNLTQLARVVAEVQKTSMSMRMVAVGTLFRKMSRLIRDLSRKSGKQVELITVGDEVELDRGIVDDLVDPMVHMIRNAVDHGIETVEERKITGKPECGSVRLKATHDAGDIVIEISDDGRGLDAKRILEKARKKGLAGENDHLDEEAIFRLIFEPGFSTAEKVTDLSGRGVGLDVVKKQMQKLRGRIAIRSTPGEGCAFVLRLPLTLAIVDGLVVGVGAQRYILPMFAVREMFSPGPGTFVTLENRAEAALFRDKLLPVVRLSRLLETRAEDRPGGVLIVAEARGQLFCIAVDQLIGKQEVVIKSLGKTYRDVPAISGGSILGDGRVGLIIDVNSLRYRN